MGLKYKFSKAERLIKILDKENPYKLETICREIRIAQNKLLKEAGRVLTGCQDRCRGLCCRNIHPDEIITQLDFVYILKMEDSMRDMILKCSNSETMYSANCVFLEGGEGPCILPPNSRPEKCIITFCGEETPIKKEIRLVRSNFNRLLRYIFFRKARAFKNILLRL